MAAQTAEARAFGLDILIGPAATLPAGFLLGHAQDVAGATGCTAVLCTQGAVGGVSVRGGAPATRETDLLDPRNTVERVNAVVLSGGSAFGLDASGGVMRWLAGRGAGFAVGGAVVPIVCGACIFDLTVGSGDVRPDAAMGYAACETAGTTVTCGNVGVGTGASIGKLLGEKLSMKSGFGAASVRIGELAVTALVAVNALGNVFDRSRGLKLAGTRNPADPSALLDPYEAFLLMLEATGGGRGSDAAGNAGDDIGNNAGNGAGVGAGAAQPPSNTTIGCVLTNGALTKTQISRVADMAHDGFARAIEPVHTSFDGDAIFALTTANVPTAPDLVGALAATAMEAAILSAVLSATAAYGLPSAHELSPAAPRKD
ncbi:MAG: P1 family peptidase [Coriobacteriales bacterium]|jgi:L-aminopeptidase/D-esterase-like protein|nr:P1 family peptidase [Coriobacteriales bacterium]